MKLENTAQGEASQFGLFNNIVSMIKQLNTGLVEKGSRLGLVLNLLEKQKFCENLGLLGMDGKIILQWILKQYEMYVLTGDI